MDTNLRYLMCQLEYGKKKLSELQYEYMQSVREEMENAHFDKGISEYWQSAIEAIESTIASRQKDIDAIETNEEFVNRFGEGLHDLYKKDTSGFNKFTTLENAETSHSSWGYLIPGEPIELDFSDGVSSPIIPMSAFPQHEETHFVTYKNKSLYVSLAFAPEINTVFVRV